MYIWLWLWQICGCCWLGQTHQRLRRFCWWSSSSARTTAALARWHCKHCITEHNLKHVRFQAVICWRFFMPVPVLIGRKPNVFYVHSTVLNLLNTTFWTNEPTLMQIGTNDLLGKGMKRSTLVLRGQRSMSQEAEVRFGGLAEASVSTPWVE